MIPISKHRLTPVFWILMFVSVGILSALLFAPKVSAAPAAENRPPYNNAETNRRNNCIANGWDVKRYGAIWFNNDAGNYYAGSVNVNATANSAPVLIRGSVYGCHHPGVDDIYAVNVTPTGPNAWRLTGLGSTTLYRGKSQGSHNWSTQGGAITAMLDVSGLATNNLGKTDTQTIIIGLYRCFSTTGTNPTGSCGEEQVEVTVIREPAPVQSPSGTISGTCSKITGTANDPDKSEQAIEVHAYADGPYAAGAEFTPRFVGSRYANLPGDAFDIDVSAYNGAGPRTFWVYLIGINSSGVPDGNNPLLGTVTIGPCVPPSCGNLAINPTLPEQGEQFDLNISFNQPIGMKGNPTNYTVVANIPGIYVGPMGVGIIPASGSGGSGNKMGLTAPIAGVYNGIVTVSGDITLACPIEIQIATKPYARFYNGDVRAGAALNCPGWTNNISLPTADIDGQYNPNSNKGMGVQLAAFAAGSIDGFGSAFARTAVPIFPKGLSFANVSGTYGGNYGQRFCPENYFGMKPLNLIADISGNLDLASLNPEGNHERFYTGNVKIKQHLKIKRRAAIYVEGNVLIEKSPEVGLDTGAASIEELPSLYVIVKGNIYIEQGAANMSGVFIAQPDLANPNTGRIYTCSTNSFTPQANIKADCDDKLTVNGAFIAKQIRFFRSNGTVSTGSAGEASNTTSIAEAMVFSPDIWLAPTPNSLRGDIDDYDAITSLPPLL